MANILKPILTDVLTRAIRSVFEYSMGAPLVVGIWLLESGAWNDGGTWDDAATWNDGV